MTLLVIYGIVVVCAALYLIGAWLLSRKKNSINKDGKGVT